MVPGGQGSEWGASSPESTGPGPACALGAAGGEGGQAGRGHWSPTLVMPGRERRRLAGTSQRFRANLRVAAGPDLAESAPGPGRGGRRLAEVGAGWGMATASPLPAPAEAGRPGWLAAAFPRAPAGGGGGGVGSPGSWHRAWRPAQGEEWLPGSGRRSVPAESRRRRSPARSEPPGSRPSRAPLEPAASPAPAEGAGSTRGREGSRARRALAGRCRWRRAPSASGPGPAPRSARPEGAGEAGRPPSQPHLTSRRRRRLRRRGLKAGVGEGPGPGSRTRCGPGRSSPPLPSARRARAARLHVPDASTAPGGCSELGARGREGSSTAGVCGEQDSAVGLRGSERQGTTRFPGTSGPGRSARLGDLWPGRLRGSQWFGERHSGTLKREGTPPTWGIFGLGAF